MTPEENKKRYNEIREEVENIKRRLENKSSRFTTDEELMALINKGSTKRSGHRDAAYERKLRKRQAKKRGR